ncbi:hypothetical protein [Antricoccus suffuscus]|nr:hypothetical protein [Antricoccus suffuscus]
MTVPTPPEIPVSPSASVPQSALGPAKPSFFGQIVADLRADLSRNGRRLALAIGLYVLGGIVAGVAWALWAPRERFQTVKGGYAYVDLNAEWQVGGDVVLFLMLLTLTLVLTVWLWGWGPRRGLVALMTTVGGSVLAGFVAWLVGIMVTSKPSATDLKTLGAVFSIDQRLHSVAMILLPAVIAALLYVVLAMFSGYDGLWRRAEIAQFNAAQENAVGGATPASNAPLPHRP